MAPFLREAWTWRPIGIGLMLLVALLGFCVFDHHADTDHGHGVVVDLCLAMLAAPFVVMAMSLIALGFATPLPALAVVPASLHVLDPPPKCLPIR